MSKVHHLLHEGTVIQAFVSYLAEHGHLGLQVDRWPDKENRQSTDIDALAGRFAIEHTSIDTVNNQRRENQRFLQAAGDLEAELSGQLQYRLSLMLPYEGIQIGQNWSGMKSALRLWVINQASTLPDGSHIIKGLPGIPFDFRATKSTSRQPGLYLSRSCPDDPSLPTRVRELCDRKTKKLSPYKTAGYTTILLAESNDIALMNEFILANAIRGAYPAGFPNEVDEVWFADTAIPTEVQFLSLSDAVVGHGTRSS